MPDAAYIQKLEEAACRAKPALATRYYDGWLLRVSQGYTRRANAIYPLYGSSCPLDDKLTFCEALYMQRGQPVQFKLTASSQPPDLERRLQDRGYTRGTVALVQTLTLTPSHLPSAMTFPGSFRLTGGWLSDYIRLSHTAPEHQDTLTRMFELIRLPTYYAALTDDYGRVVAMGVAVQDGPLVGIFDVVVDERHRRRGWGRRLMEHLLAWGRWQGGQTAYLQVNVANIAAQRLYQQMCFQEQYHYWYYQLAPTPAKR